MNCRHAATSTGCHRQVVDEHALLRQEVQHVLGRLQHLGEATVTQRRLQRAEALAVVGVAREIEGADELPPPSPRWLRLRLPCAGAGSTGAGAGARRFRRDGRGVGKRGAGGDEPLQGDLETSLPRLQAVEVRRGRPGRGSARARPRRRGRIASDETGALAVDGLAGGGERVDAAAPPRPASAARSSRWRSSSSASQAASQNEHERHARA